MRPIELEGKVLSIFPAKPASYGDRAKTPFTWNGFKAASSDPAQIALVAVPTGPRNDICVLDADAKHNGAAWLREHFGDAGPRTRIHSTMNGGQHLIYRNRPGLKLTAGLIAPGIDTRGDGNGYFIWWPSHGCPVLNEGPVADWPASLDQALAAAIEARTKRYMKSATPGVADCVSSMSYEGTRAGEIPKPLYNLVKSLMPGSLPLSRRRVIGILRPLVEARDGRWWDLFGKARTFWKPGGPIADGLITSDATAQLLFMTAALNGTVEKRGADRVWDAIWRGLDPQDINDTQHITAGEEE
jgi:hypothetical protein